MTHKYVTLSEGVFSFSVSASLANSLKEYLQYKASLPQHFADIQERKRLLYSSLFYRMLTHCAGAALHLQCSTFQHSSRQKEDILCTISRPLPLPFYPLFSLLPLSFSQFWLLAPSQGGGGALREREMGRGGGGGGVSVKSKLSLSGPHRHMLIHTPSHIRIC